MSCKSFASDLRGPTAFEVVLLLGQFYGLAKVCLVSVHAAFSCLCLAKGHLINSEPPKGTEMKTITYGAIIDHLWY